MFPALSQEWLKIIPFFPTTKYNKCVCFPDTKTANKKEKTFILYRIVRTGWFLICVLLLFFPPRHICLPQIPSPPGDRSSSTVWHLQLKVFVSWKGWLLICGADQTLTGRLRDAVTQAWCSAGGHRERCRGPEAQS